MKGVVLSMVVQYHPLLLPYYYIFMDNFISTDIDDFFSFFRPSALSLPEYLLFLNVQLTGNRVLSVSVLFLSNKNRRSRISNIFSNLWYKVERKDNARYQILCFSNS